MSDEQPTPASERVSDPFGVIPDSSFPRSYNEYRVTAPFIVMAHSEEQARQRWEFFQRVLEELFTVAEFPNELVSFVMPATMLNPGLRPSVELVEEHTIERATKLHGSMGSGTLPEWMWLDPEHDADWDSEQLARHLAGLDDDDED